MGKILPNFKKEIINEILNNIEANVSQYYAFASHPIQYPNTVPLVANTDYDNLFVNDWTMLFGKKISRNDIAPVIKKIIWQSNTVYSM